MCFSATASFGASALLSIAGTVAVIGGETKAQRLFGAVPFIFSVQQFSEGMLWLAVKNPHLQTWESVFTYSFLVFALLVWPTYIPFSVWLLETNKRRKKILTMLLGTGVAISLFLLYVLLSYPVHVIAANHHIHFTFDFPLMSANLTGFVSLLYFTATIMAPLVSGIKRMKWLGIVFLATYIFAVIFFSGFLVSVWCFFAAILSLVVVWIVWGFRKPVSMVQL